MATLGNRTFTGLIDGQKDADLLRRLNNLSSTAYGAQDNLNAANKIIAQIQASQLTTAQVIALLQNPAIIKNITNANGIVGTPQPASISTVTSLPAVSSALTIGQAVIFQNEIYTWNGAKWVQSVVATLFDTHANRLANYPPANYAVGTLFVETDRHVVYYCKFDGLTAHANEWYYASGTYVDVSANRPTLGVYEDGYLFQSSDHFIEWKYSGSGAYWTYIGGEDSGTLANITAAGGAGGPTSHDAGMKYGATDVGHRFVWFGSGWDFAPGDCLSGWSFFGSAFYGDSGLFVLVPSGGGTISGITTPTGTATGTVTFGVWSSPIVGSVLWVRI